MSIRFKVAFICFTLPRLIFSSCGPPKENSEQEASSVDTTRAQQLQWSINTDSSAKELSYVIKTDSSSIDVICKPNSYKITSEHFTGTNLTHLLVYFADTITVEHDRYYTGSSEDNRVGIHKIFNSNGKLALTINEDIPSWKPANVSDYPNFPVLNAAKAKGDSIIKSIYSEEFFNKYLKWNIYSSYYFDKTYTSEPSFSMEWLRDDTKYNKATEFDIEYDIHYNKIYEGSIQIIIDREGNLLPEHLWNNNWTIYNKGLEKLPIGSSHNFVLTIDEAIAIARKKGLKEIDSSKVRGELVWEPNNSDKIFNGRFRIYIFEELETNSKAANGYFIVDKHYNIWVFNPWTGKFLKKRKVYQRTEGGNDFSTIGAFIDE